MSECIRRLGFGAAMTEIKARVEFGFLHGGFQEKRCKLLVGKMILFHRKYRGKDILGRFSSSILLSRGTVKSV